MDKDSVMVSLSVTKIDETSPLKPELAPDPLGGSRPGPDNRGGTGAAKLEEGRDEYAVDQVQPEEEDGIQSESESFAF